MKRKAIVYGLAGIGLITIVDTLRLIANDILMIKLREEAVERVVEHIVEDMARPGIFVEGELHDSPPWDYARD